MHIFFKKNDDFDMASSFSRIWYIFPSVPIFFFVFFFFKVFFIVVLCISYIYSLVFYFFNAILYGIAYSILFSIWLLFLLMKIYIFSYVVKIIVIYWVLNYNNFYIHQSSIYSLRHSWSFFFIVFGLSLQFLFIVLAS